MTRTEFLKKVVATFEGEIGDMKTTMTLEDVAKLVMVAATVAQFTAVERVS